ncbi:hypothetical protein Gpo141_00010847 [Globisporangium polare]
MVRVGVHTSVASANVSSEIQPQFHETVYAAAAATISTQTHPLERHPSSQNGSVRNAAEVWKGQLTKSLSRRKDLLNPPVHDNVVVVTPAMLRAMPVRARMRFVLTRPEESRLGWCVHHLILVIVSIDVFLVLTLRTLDGPRFSRGTDPAYPYLPTQKQFDIAEKLLSTVYTFEFVLRWATASSQRKYWKSMQTWVALLALLPVFVSQAGMSTADDPDGDDALASRFATSLRFVRILRLPLMSKVHVGSKVMFEAISKSLAPLRITLFFLIAVVMVFATGVFYAEPCYDLQECSFTDIFNAGYFIMVTVATVGYGSQVPSLRNGGSLILTCVVMIFGQLYLSMPLAIIGINYNLAWKDHDDRVQQLANAKIAREFAELAATVSVSRASKSPKRAVAFSELQPMPSCAVFVQSHQILSLFCELTQKTAETTRAIQSAIAQRAAAMAAVAAMADPSSSPPSVPAAPTSNSKGMQETNVRIVDNLALMLRLHKSLTIELRLSLPQLTRAECVKANTMAPRDPVLNDSAQQKTPRRSNSLVVAMFGRATKAFRSENQVEYVKKQYYHTGPPTFRSMVWDIFEHNSFSRLAQVVHRVRLLVVIMSIALFYLQTTPELQKTGIRTVLCRRTIADFCHSRHQPGCFVLDSEGSVTATRLDFYCSDPTGTDDSPLSSCYGEGSNFGSDRFTGSCSDAFGLDGTRRVCNNRVCKPGTNLVADMEPQWINFEFAFGTFFTIEMLLRAFSHPLPQKLWKDPTLLVDFIALFPFYVEIGELITGLEPIYSVVPTEPTFFTGVRVLKAIRILKLGTHIPGARVLTRTALLVYQRLTIPLFFLFLGCAVSGAIFYELERGTECYVGRGCLWWHKNVLTEVLAEGLPEGKRVMVQNTKLTIIVDMLRSTWLALVTFTTVGYGDVVPRTSFGKLFDILGVVFSACYTAMPLSLVGGQFYICYEAHVKEEKKRRQSANPIVEPEEKESRVAQQERETSQTRAQESHKRLDCSTSDLKARDDAGWKITPMSVSTDPPTSPEPIVPSTSSEVRPAAPADDVTSTGRKLPSSDAQVLSQFTLIQQVLTKVVDDLNKLNLQVGRRISLRRSFLEPLNRAEIELKICNNMLYTETVLLNCASVIDRIQEL